jgi:hypothetical protein
VGRIRDILGLPLRAADLIDIHEIRFRDATTGAFVGSIDHPVRPQRPHSVAFSPDGRTLVVSYLPADFKGWSSSNPMIDWDVELWSIPTGKQVRGKSAWAAAVAASSLVLAVVGFDRWRARRRRPAAES